MKLRKTFAALCAVGLMSVAGGAQAAIILDNWKINLEAIGAQPEDSFVGFGVFGAVNGIQEAAFNGLFHSVAPGVGPFPAVGDLATANVVGQVSNALSTVGPVVATSTGKFLNFDFELTFGATTTQKITEVTPSGTFSTHLGAGAGPDGVETNGFLTIYADVLTAGNLSGAQGNVSFTTGGAGLQDGVVLAVFRILDAGGANTGSFNNSPAALNGQDDATFELFSNPFGAITDFAGVPLPTGSTLAFVDADTDSDPDNNGALGTSPAAFPPAGGSCGATPRDNCGTENGSFILAAQQVPEPGTMALFGLSLLGLGAFRRRLS